MLDYLLTMEWAASQEEGDLSPIPPTQAYRGDVGWDLYAVRDVDIEPSGFANVPIGISVALPEGIYARIVGRSSAWHRRQLTVVEGLIDTGYRGPIWAAVRNEGKERQTVERGERVAQMVLVYTVPVQWSQVDELPTSERGALGFGSTGR